MLLEALLAAIVAAQEPQAAQAFVQRAALAMEKVKDDRSLDRTHRLATATEGVADADRALAIDAQNVAALVYKGLLLRYEAALVDGVQQQDALIRQAGELRDKARSLLRQTGDGTLESSPPEEFDAAAKRVNAVHVPRNGPPPRKAVDVRVEYPNVQTTAGTIVLDLLVDSSGQASYLCVRRAPEGLNGAVLAGVLKAVSGWKYVPLLLDNQFRPFLVTVTVTIDVRLDKRPTNY